MKASGTGVLVVIEANRWQVLNMTADGEIRIQDIAIEDRSIPDMAAQIAGILADWNCQEEHICLGLPSRMVLAAEISCSGLSRKNRSSAMLYRLEEQLPLEAERVTADFLPRIGGSAMGVAVETERLKTIIDALNACGVQTASACPTSLLGLWDYVAGKAQITDYVIIRCNGLEIFRMVGGQPVAWYTAGEDTLQAVKSIRADLLCRPTDNPVPTAIMLGNPEETLVTALEKAGINLIGTDQEPPINRAARSAQAALEGRPAGWVNLRKGAMSLGGLWKRFTTLMRSAVILGVLLLVVLSGTFWIRAWRYEARTSQYEKLQAAIYRRISPNTAIPLNIASRLHSELARCEAVSGEDSRLPTRHSALETLRVLVSALPQQTRFRLVDVRIDPDGLFIDGEAREHSGAQAIEQTLAMAGLAMDQPRTQTIPGGGVSFTLTGHLSEGRPTTATATKPTGGRP